MGHDHCHHHHLISSPVFDLIPSWREKSREAPRWKISKLISHGNKVNNEGILFGWGFLAPHFTPVSSVGGWVEILNQRIFKMGEYSHHTSQKWMEGANLDQNHLYVLWIGWAKVATNMCMPVGGRFLTKPCQSKTPSTSRVKVSLSLLLSCNWMWVEDVCVYLPQTTPNPPLAPLPPNKWSFWHNRNSFPCGLGSLFIRGVATTIEIASPPPCPKPTMLMMTLVKVQYDNDYHLKNQTFNNFS